MERWRLVKGFEDYHVSDLGIIKRVVALERTRVGKILTPWGKKYQKVTLHKNGKRYVRYVHILVATAFIPNPLGLSDVNHLGQASDYRAIKLEWRSHQGNMQDVALRGARSGVTFYRPLGKWRVKVKGKHVGYFPTKTKAVLTRRAAVDALPYII